jgi:hypothetical protein
MSDPNRELFERVVRLLEPVLDELVFVGGCATGLMITDPAAAGIRPTKDVDAIVNVTSYAMYSALSARLRAIGLTEDATDGAPTGRWRHEDASVDIMPTDRGVLGFSNSWYSRALESAAPVTIAGLQPRVVAPAYFLATKLEAFQGRGHADVVTSSDLEDIVLVVDGRPQLLAEIEQSDPQVRQFIASEIAALMANRRFRDCLAGFLPQDRASQARRPLLERRLTAIAALAAKGPDPAIL